jgi:hypothetical protein
MMTMLRAKAVRPINPNSFAYFMGFNAFRLKRPKNPFHFYKQSQAAKDWLHGFVAASNLKAMS